jgi:hypothetical protein
MKLPNVRNLWRHGRDFLSPHSIPALMTTRQYERDIGADLTWLRRDQSGQLRTHTQEELDQALPENMTPIRIGVALLSEALAKRVWTTDRGYLYRISDVYTVFNFTHGESPWGSKISFTDGSDWRVYERTAGKNEDTLVSFSEAVRVLAEKEKYWSTESFFVRNSSRFPERHFSRYTGTPTEDMRPIPRTDVIATSVAP